MSEISVNKVIMAEESRMKAMGETGNMQGKKGCMKKLNNAGKGSVFVIVAIALIAILIACGFCTGIIQRFYMANFSKPVDYLTYVEKNEFTGKDFRQRYKNVKNVFKQYDLTQNMIEQDLEFRIGERGTKLLGLSKMVGVDLSWLQSFGLRYAINTKDDKSEIKAALSVNGQTFLSPSMMLDLTKKFGYFLIPELSEDVICIDMSSEFKDENFMELLSAKSEKMKNAYPDEKTLEKLLKKYIDLVSAQLETVEKEKKVDLECSGVSQKCTALKVSLKEEDLKKICKVLCKELSEDEEFKKIYLNYYRAVLDDKSSKSDDKEVDGSDQEGASGAKDNALEKYEAFQKSLKDSYENMDKVNFNTKSLTVTLYVDAGSDIVGRVYEIVSNSDEKTVYRLLMPTKKEKAGLEISVMSNDKTVSLTGEGRLKGKKLSGEFVLRAQDKSLVNVKVEEIDLDFLNSGKKKGHVTVSLSQEIDMKDLLEKTREYSEDAYNLLVVGIGNMRPGIDVKWDATDKKGVVEIALIDGDADVFRFVSTAYLKKRENITIPDKVIDSEDEEALMECLDNLNFPKMKENLEKAGVPGEYLKTFEQYGGGLGSSYVRYINRSRDAKDRQMIRSWETAARSALSQLRDDLDDGLYYVTISPDGISVTAAMKYATGLDKLKDAFCEMADLTDGFDFAAQMSSKTGRDIDHVTITIDIDEGMWDIEMDAAMKHPEKYSFDNIRY